MTTRTIELDRPYELAATLRILHRGSGDPTMQLGPHRVARAFRVDGAPVTLLVEQDGSRLHAEAWGAGADPALDRLEGILGLDDDRSGFESRLHPLVHDLDRRHPGLRLGRTGSVIDALVPAILEQKVTGTEAFGAYRRLVLGHGEPSPGPLGLRLPPDAATIAALPSWTFPRLGIEPRRGALLRRVAGDAERLEALAAGAAGRGGGGAGAGLLRERLTAYRGIGPWTAAEVALRSLGDPDAVSVGDFHLPHLVTYALTGRARGSDETMLALLEPWRGHRARVVRLLESSGLAAPRFGPRLAPRDLRSL